MYQECSNIRILLNSNKNAHARNCRHPLVTFTETFITAIVDGLATYHPKLRRRLRATHKPSSCLALEHPIPGIPKTPKPCGATDEPPLMVAPVHTCTDPSARTPGASGRMDTHLRKRRVHLFTHTNFHFLHVRILRIRTHPEKDFNLLGLFHGDLYTSHPALIYIVPAFPPARLAPHYTPQIPTHPHTSPPIPTHPRHPQPRGYITNIPTLHTHSN